MSNLEGADGRRRVGIIGPPAWPREGETTEPIYGAQVAVAGMNEALRRHSQFALHFFWSQRGPRSRSAVQPAGTEKKREYYESSVLDLLTPGALQLAVFHAVGISALLPTIRARNRFAPSLPVTAIHHTISYPSEYETLLPLLLGGLDSRDTLICTSPAALGALEELFAILSARAPCEVLRPTLSYIPLGVDTSLYTPRDKSEARALLSLPQDAKLVLWIGRFSLGDKVDLLPLMQAFRVVQDRQARARLVLVGGETTGYSEVVRYLGRELGITEYLTVRVNPPLGLVPLYYNAADVFVAPTDNVQETFGLVVVEAMASGCPVVASDWDGYRDSVRHGKTGFLVPTRGPRSFPQLAEIQGIGPWQSEHALLSQMTTVSIDAMAESICDALQEEVARKVGRAACAYARAHFDWRVVIRKCDDLWTTLASRPRVERNSRDLTQPEYLQMFARYWSEQVSPDAVITAGGSKGCISTAGLYRYVPEMQQIIPTRVAEAVIQAVTGKPSTLRQVSSALNIGLTEVELCALWLAKHGLLRFMEGEVGGPPLAG